MNQIMKHVIEQMPPVPEDIYNQFSNHNIAIVKSVLVLAGKAQFNCYEFVVPYSRFPETQISNNRFIPECGKIFAINPGQIHSCLISENTPCSYISMFVNRTFLQEIARTIFGRGDVCFDFGSNPFNKNLDDLIKMFMEESSEWQSGYEFILESLSTQIVINLLRQVKNSLSDAKPCLLYSVKSDINKVTEFLKENYNRDYSLKDVAMLANLSPYHFIRVFKAETGKTPFEYLLDIKIEKAREMLQLKNRTITEVCFLSGFKNLSHFTTVFRKETGTTPTQYRKTVLGD